MKINFHDCTEQCSHENTVNYELNCGPKYCGIFCHTSTDVSEYWSRYDNSVLETPHMDLERVSQIQLSKWLSINGMLSAEAIHNLFCHKVFQDQDQFWCIICLAKNA